MSITIENSKELEVILKGILNSFRQRNLFLSIAFAALYLLGALLPYYFILVQLSRGQVAWLGLLLVTPLWVAVMQRALENLVHDASHYNWSLSKLTNDIAATLMVAAPVMQWLPTYRPPHIRHHQDTGGERDPCKNRPVMKMTGLSGEPTRWEIIRFAIRDLPSTNADYYNSQFQSGGRGLVSFVAWHAVMMIAPAIYLLGFELGLTTWIIYWLLPMIGVLPIIRAVAERWEHDYATAEGKVQTYSNLGWIDRFIFHPAGDAFHAAHHAQPAVPAYRMRRLHNALMKFSETFPNHPVRLA